MKRKASQGSSFVRGEVASPRFFPLKAEAARHEIEWLLHQSPYRYGIQRARWRLQDVGCVIAWLKEVSAAGISQVLKRLGFSRKQAVNFIRSPDLAYHDKWRAILQAYQEALEHPDEVVILFQDELTYYRQPSQAPAYHRCGKGQPRARQEPGHNTQTRIAAALHGVTGQVTYLQRNQVDAEALVLFYAQIRAAYPQAKVIYLVQDNWPVHKLPQVLQAAAEQRLTLLFLPTYATWLNPIEKLWRWLRQEVLHLHELAHDLPLLRQRVCAFLDQFSSGSDALLRYVGLLPD
jgi:transposase